MCTIVTFPCLREIDESTEGKEAEKGLSGVCVLVERYPRVLRLAAAAGLNCRRVSPVRPGTGKVAG